jgi:hypothetical protein
VPDRLSIKLSGSARTEDPETVEFAFMRGKRGASFESLYRTQWKVRAPRGTAIEIVLESEKGGTDRRSVTLAP